MPDPKSAASGALSRRVVIGAVSAGTLSPMEQTGSFNQTSMLCKAWLAIEAERYRLTRHWAKLEDYMAKHHDWLKLTDAEQLALPEAAKMHAIDARLTALQRAREEILPQLPALPAQDRRSLLLKLQVVEALLPPEESPEAKALLKSSLRDLADLWR